MGHTCEFSSDIWIACTFWRNLSLLLLFMSSTVECDGKPCSNKQVDLRIECSIGRTVLPKNLCSCAAKSSNLTKLFIKGNKDLKRLPEGLPKNLTRLTRLEIKVNPNLTELPKGLLENVTNLKVLDLQQNSLSVAPNVDYLTNLLELTLAYNPIQILPNDYLKSNTNLTLFKATGIGLTEVPHYLFKTTTQLKYLHLDDNQITTLTKDIFQNLDSLLALNLARNSLSSLRTTIFKDLGSLSYLDLSRNKLSTIVETLYPIRSNLKELKLSSNRLEMFELSKNFPFNEIRLLDLSKNNISRFDAAALSQNLTRLYLDNNNLSGLSEEVIGYLKHNVKTGVKLGGNKFACNCRSLKLIEFLNDHIYKVLDIQDINFDCNPSEPFSDFRTEDRVCPNLGRSVNRIYLILGFLLLCAVLIGLMDRFRLRSKKEPGNLDTQVSSAEPEEASPQPHQFVSRQNSMTETVSADYLFAVVQPLDDMGSVDDVWGGHPQFLPVSGENSVAETVSSADFDLDEDIEYEELVPGGGYPFPWHVRRQNSTTETFSADYLLAEDEPREGFLQPQPVSEQNSTETASADYLSAEDEDLDHVPGGGHPQFSQNSVAETLSADYVSGDDKVLERVPGEGNPLPHWIRRQNSTTETISVDYLTADDEPLDSDQAVGTGVPLLQQLRTSSDPQENTVDENMDGSFLYDAFISYANEDERWVMVSERRMMISQTYNPFINFIRSSCDSNASDDTNKKVINTPKNMTMII